MSSFDLADAQSSLEVVSPETISIGATTASAGAFLATCDGVKRRAKLVPDPPGIDGALLAPLEATNFTPATP